MAFILSRLQLHPDKTLDAGEFEEETASAALICLTDMYQRRTWKRKRRECAGAWKEGAILVDDGSGVWQWRAVAEIIT